MPALQSSSPSLRKLTFEQFVDEFRPITNPLDKHAPVNGYGFEPFGAELNYVRAAAATTPDRVWTVVDHGDDTSDDESGTEQDSPPWQIVQGMHFVNRVCYLITAVAPAPEDALDCIDY